MDDRIHRPNIETKLAEQAALLDLTSDAIIVRDELGRIKFWNRGAEELYGWSRDEALRRTTHELLRTQFPIPLSEIVRHIRENSRWQGELVHRTKSGRQITVLSRWGLLPEKDDSTAPDLMETNTDITHRKQIDEALTAQKDWLRTILTSIGDAVIATDAHGLITLMNPAAEKLTGWKFNDAQGKPLAGVFRIIDQETRQTVENPVDKVRRLNRVVGLANHTLLISKSGQEIAIDDSGAPIFAPDGALAGIVLVFRDVTDARNVEAKLTAQAALLDLTSDAIIVRDESGHIKFLNRGAEELYGWSREEALRRTTHELLRTQFPIPLPEIVRHIRENNRWQGELIHSTKSGRQIAVLSRWGLLPAKDGATVPPDLMETNTDITARKQAEEQIRAQREWLRTILTSIGDAVISTDALGLITLMNPVAEKLTGWTFKESKDKPLAEIFRIVNQDTRQTVENPVDKVRRLNRVVGLANHTILITKSGQEIAIDDSGAPIFDPDGTLAGTVLVFRDVTHQRQLEAALQSNERLALAGRLSASIAHEIHNPLDTVGNVLFLLDQRVGEQPQARHLIQTAQNEVQRVAEISKNMLSLHRESRAPTAIKLSELLEGVVSLIEETIAKGRRTIKVVPGSEAEIEAFPSELRQVFTNVLKNAVEATSDSGEIKIYSAAAQESGQDGVLVRVVDNGVGIPEQLQSKLFSPFVSTKEERGTGLGLWVSRSIVEKHGGSMRISSGIGTGTTVSIFLPLQSATRNSPNVA